jgi:arsenite methyltransferase
MTDTHCVTDRLRITASSPPFSYESNHIFYDSQYRKPNWQHFRYLSSTALTYLATMPSNTNNDTPSEWGTATETSATRYSKTNNIQQNVGQNLAQMMNVSKGQSVLVLGCGPGSDALAIAQIVGETGKVVGMDLDRHSIDRAQETLEQHPELKSYVTYHVGDAHDLSQFKGQEFDAIHVNATYHWLTDKSLFLAQAASISKNGTCIGISSNPMDYPSPALMIRNDVLLQMGEDTSDFIAFPTEAELKNDLGAAGFAVGRTSHPFTTHVISDPSAVLDWLNDSSGNKWTNYLGEEKRKVAHKNITEEMKGLCLPDGRPVVQIQWLLVVAHYNRTG